MNCEINSIRIRNRQKKNPEIHNLPWGRCSIEKCEIGHPPLFHSDSCKLMHDEFVLMKSFSSGSCDSETIPFIPIYFQYSSNCFKLIVMIGIEVFPKKTQS